MNSENTVLDNESRKFDDEATQLDINVKQNKETETPKNKKASVETEGNTIESNEVEKKPESGKKSIFNKSLGLGVLMGGVAATAAAMTLDDPIGEMAGVGMSQDMDIDEELSEEEIEDQESVTATSDGEIPVADSVTDDMSFSEAFSAAREEVGPGGVFEWNGNVYNTYYAEEWENMSEEEREEFASHLNVAEIDEDPADELTADEDPEGELTADVDPEGELTADEDPEGELTADEDPEGELTADEDPEGEFTADEDPEGEFTADGDPEGEFTAEVENTDYIDGESVEGVGAEDFEVTEEVIVDTEYYDEPNIEILGVYEDVDNMNVGVVEVDGQEAFLVDVDGDDDFDVMAVDVDGDGMLSELEMVDVSDAGITVDMLDVDDDIYDDGFDDGFDDGMDPFEDESLAFNDDMDYINDADVDDYMA